MQTIFSAAASALFVLGSTGIAAPLTTLSGEGWVADYDAALALAKETNKDVLVDFTGSDWCGWCIRLDNEVFSKDAFKAYADEHFVLCALDFPNGEEARAKVPNPERNAEVQQQFGIQGFPTILLMTKDGELYAQTGYQAGGPEAYVTHLTEITTAGKAALARVRELGTAYEAAEEAQRPAVLATIVDAYLEMGDAAPARNLVAYVEKAVALEGDAHAAMRIKALRALLTNGAASAEMTAMARRLDPENAEGLLELCVQSEMFSVQSIEELQPCLDKLEALLESGNISNATLVGEMCGNGARWYAEYLDNPEGARRLGTKALELGMENERMRDAVQMMLDSLEETAEPEAEPAVRG
ncbi:Disulfide bond reductase DsbH precursor [Planctomycetes bacterium Pla163]|uniref:Disulfide bond reductase DsbH n=1 Tax=Rohdeia mirabilis TaxID=2528008 RepID=A0A518CY12_9BACT|nr:Disulfide bond reductase DsbH precursor [Planctomycetes bacterium Pla163]